MTGSDGACKTDGPGSSRQPDLIREKNRERNSFYLLTPALMGDPLPAPSTKAWIPSQNQVRFYLCVCWLSKTRRKPLHLFARPSRPRALRWMFAITEER